MRECGSRLIMTAMFSKAREKSWAFLFLVLDSSTLLGNTGFVKFKDIYHFDQGFRCAINVSNQMLTLRGSFVLPWFFIELDVDPWERWILSLLTPEKSAILKHKSQHLGVVNTDLQFKRNIRIYT